MKRYFGKIDENKKDIQWEVSKKTNDVLMIFPSFKYYSYLCVSTIGNLFAVFEEEEDTNEMLKVLFLSESSDGMKEYFNFDEFTQEDVFYWATYIGDRDILTDKITTSEYAYYWAYPLDRETARIMAKNDPFILNEFKDCGMSKEHPINMRIVRVNY